MPEIRFPCTGCKVSLKLSDELAGKKIRCPKCKAVVAVPVAAAPPAPMMPTFAPTPPSPIGPTYAPEPRRKPSLPLDDAPLPALDEEVWPEPPPADLEMAQEMAEEGPPPKKAEPAAKKKKKKRLFDLLAMMTTLVVVAYLVAAALVVTGTVDVPLEGVSARPGPPPGPSGPLPMPKKDMGKVAP